MGVEQADCRQVAELIGVKTFINELYAFSELGDVTITRILLLGCKVWTGVYEFNRLQESISTILRLSKLITELGLK